MGHDADAGAHGRTFGRTLLNLYIRACGETANHSHIIISAAAKEHLPKFWKKSFFFNYFFIEKFVSAVMVTATVHQMQLHFVKRFISWADPTDFGQMHGTKYPKATFSSVSDHISTTRLENIAFSLVMPDSIDTPSTNVPSEYVKILPFKSNFRPLLIPSVHFIPHWKRSKFNDRPNLDMV